MIVTLIKWKGFVKLHFELLLLLILESKESAQIKPQYVCIGFTMNVGQRNINP